MSRVPAPRKGLLHVRAPKITGPARRTVPGAGGGGRGPAAKGGDEGYLYLAGVRDASKRITEYSSEKDTCPVCHTDKQFNPSMRLLVSPCYHRMCESCIDRLYSLGPEPCPAPGCGRLLRKMNFQHQTFEDLKVEREVSVRRRMAEYFNKRESDFENRREYDDHLEKVEEWSKLDFHAVSIRHKDQTIEEVADLPAFNLLNEVDVDETEAQIASYRRLHATSIAANQSALAIEAMSATEKDELDKRIREERMRMVEAAQRTERIEDEKVRIQIVDALAKGPEGARRAQEIRSKYEEAKAARNAALAKAISAGAASQGEEGKEENTTDPLGMDYTGPWVEIPYSNPDELEYKKWAQVRADYVDARSIVRWVKEDGGRNVRGGGWDLELFWQGEVEAAVMSLGVQPLV